MSKETIKLRTPLLINGVEKTELTYDVNELTVNHLAKAEGLKVKIGGKDLACSINLAQADYTLHIFIGMMAVIAVNPEIAVEDLQRLKGYDVAQLADVGAGFFIKPAEQIQKQSNEPQEVTQDTTSVQC